MKNVSLVIPLFNEAESLPELHEWIVRVMQENSLTYEVWFINDGSSDNSWEVIEDLKAKDENVKAVKFRRNYGKSAGLFVGFERAEAEVVITMDADLQDSPEEVPELYKMVMEDGYDLVSGWKKKRYDPITKTIPTKLYNWATRRMSGIHLHDFNCGLKAYRCAVIKSIEVYGEMHRYIPVMAKLAGFSKIGEKVVQHRARKYGSTKFGLERFINGPLDLMTIMFMSKFGKRPMHFFGTMGFFMFVAGAAIGLYLLITKMIDWYPITTMPMFYFCLTFIVVGVQLFMTGFLGELLIRNSATRNIYKIETVLD